MTKFTVDTHIFRELGESLVGRDSTALIELVKNSYDADATQVTVHGVYLRDAERGIIAILDNGVGMTSREFTDGFLRIASRLKSHGSRFSKRLNRRYTGAKGIGRLAAHKLARTMEIQSVPWTSQSNVSKSELQAKIDWEAIERYETLDEATGVDAVHALLRW